MEVTPIVASGRQVIEGYGNGRFRVGGGNHDGSVIVFPDRTLSWPVTTIDGLTLDDLTPVTAAEPPVDVLLIGCGARMAPLPAAIRDGLRKAGIGADAMDTGAACRTYNILLSEHRSVAAALIAVL